MRPYRAPTGRPSPPRERGAGSVELVIATPLLLILIVAVVQFALWAHGVHCARATATEAIEATRVEGGTTAAGQARAHQVLAQVGTGLLTHPQVRVTRTAATARVTLTADIQRVLPIPGLTPTTSVAITAPTERFTPREPARAAP